MTESALLLVLVIGSAAIAAPPGWDLVFEDQFDQLNLGNWDLIDTNVTTNASRQDYLPEQVSVAGGNLVITSENIPSRGLPYRSGQVMSTQTWHRVRVEVVADLPATRGMWPAIWLLPDVNQWPWPSQGEIDIMENRGNQPTLTSGAFHWGTNPPFNHSFFAGEQQTTRFGQPTDFHDGFHTYAVDWEPDQLRYYVDDVHYFTVYDEDVGGFISRQSAPMNLVINTAIGGTFLPNPDASTVWPQEFLVDSVRIYERSGAPARMLRNSSFDQNRGSLAGWTVFGNRGTNVSVDDEAVRDGIAALKLFGQFSDDLNISGVVQIMDVVEGDLVEASVDSLVRSADSIAGTENIAAMAIEFYDKRDAKFGSSHLVGTEFATIADASTGGNQWHANELRAVVPAGAVEARLALIFIQPDQEGGAVYLDNVHFETGPIPEPSALALFLFACLSLVMVREPGGLQQGGETSP